MSTTTTLVDFKQRLVTVLDAALTVQVSYAWPGPNTESSTVFLGRPMLLDTDRHRTVSTSEIPTMKAGRKQRQERYTVDLTVWVFRPDLSSDGAATAEAAAFDLCEAIDGVLANDTTIGLSSILWAQLVGVDAELIPFERGWASVIVMSIEVEARLT